MYAAMCDTPGYLYLVNNHLLMNVDWSLKLSRIALNKYFKNDTF